MRHELRQYLLRAEGPPPEHYRRIFEEHADERWRASGEEYRQRVLAYLSTRRPQPPSVRAGSREAETPRTIGI
jgi:hypothetical protein